MASTDYYVVFSVGVDRLIERAGKASGRDGLKGRCAGKRRRRRNVFFDADAASFA